MIQQLILNTLLACTSSTESELIIEEVEPSEEIKIPQKTIFLHKDLSSITTPKSTAAAPNEAIVRLSHIPYPRTSFNDQLFCTYICNYANQGRGVNVVKTENCRVDLVSNWEEQREGLTWEEIADKGDPAVGSVQCDAYFEPPVIMRGRAALRPVSISENNDDLGGYFARAAQEEMTAVFAFQEMKENLRSLGAPQQLLDDCEKAIQDEQRHTIMMTALAKRHGCTSAVVELPKHKQVSLFTLAKHNAVAGCIEETWSALYAEYQAKHTKRYAKLFKIIAKDEVFHAQLSWNIHQWLMTKLSEDEKSEIQNLMNLQLQKSPSLPSSYQILGDMNSSTQQKIWKEFSSQLKTQITV